MRQEVVLALLAREPSHGYQLRAPLDQALRRREVSFVCQAFHLMDELTARENGELPAPLAGVHHVGAKRSLADLAGLGD